MSNSIPPVVTAGIIVIVVILLAVGVYKVIAPPHYAVAHGGQPYGPNMPPPGYFHRAQNGPDRAAAFGAAHSHTRP